MNIARMLYPVEVLGPGKRVGIWVCGCRRGCRGCSNPELWAQRPEYAISARDAAGLVGRIAAAHAVDGITVSGGEPMDQAAELAELTEYLQAYTKDILIYTGYTLEQLVARQDPDTDRVLERTAVLIDGDYREEENTDVLLRGSANQRIHILHPESAGRWAAYLETARNQIQNFTTADGVVSVGIHGRNWKQYEGLQGKDDT